MRKLLDVSVCEPNEIKRKLCYGGERGPRTVEGRGAEIEKLMKSCSSLGMKITLASG